MADQWYLQRDGKTVGPMPAEKLASMADSGQLSPINQVIGDGMSDWVTAGSLDFLEFRSTSPPAPPSIAVSRQAPVTAGTRPTIRNDKRTTLWICVAAAGVVVAAGLGWIANSAFNSDRETGKREVQNDRQPQPNPPPKNTPSDARPAKHAPIDQPLADEDNSSETKASLDELFDIPTETPDSPNQQTYVPEVEPTAQTTPKNDVTEQPPIEPMTEPQPANVESVVQPQPPKAAPKTVERPKTLFQELDVLRNPQFVIQGLSLAQQIKYRVLSQLQVSAPDEDGIRRVDQVVLDTKLDKADELSRAIFQTSLERLKGHQFSFKLNQLHEVFDFQGHKDNKQVAPVDALGGQGFLITSVMDKDGWTELAQLSFFRPKPQAQIGETWRGQMTHDWGPLGSWSGSSTYKLNAKQDDLSEIQYAYDMVYSPPAKGAAGLPFQINAAKFTPIKAGGVMHFSEHHNRVTVAAEQFHVQGLLETVVLGQPSPIQMEEQQLIQIRMLDQNPWRQ